MGHPVDFELVVCHPWFVVDEANHGTGVCE
jgi:hypothetical protein